MNKVFSLALILLPALSFGQQQKGFTISGKVAGFEDGTKVSFFDRQTNALDSMTVIKNDSFFIKGPRMEQPDFFFLVFDDKDPAIPLLMDNSSIKITGKQSDLEHLQVSGSALQESYQQLTGQLEPFDSIFQSGNFNAESTEQISHICENFVAANPSSFVSLLAVSQLLQMSKDALRSGNAFDKISKDLRNTTLGKQLSFQIEVQKTAAIGARILPFSQKDMSGKLVHIADFKGKYVLIDFWASWCQPCRMENPNVVDNYAKYKNKNFTVLGVSLDQSKNAWVSAVKADKLEWTQVSDLKGWQNEVSTLFRITSIPQNILIDPDGIIIAKNLRGPALGATLEKLLNQ